MCDRLICFFNVKNALLKIRKVKLILLYIRVKLKLIFVRDYCVSIVVCEKNDLSRWAMLDYSLAHATHHR